MSEKLQEEKVTLLKQELKVEMGCMSTTILAAIQEKQKEDRRGPSPRSEWLMGGGDVQGEPTFAHARIADQANISNPPGFPLEPQHEPRGTYETSHLPKPPQHLAPQYNYTPTIPSYHCHSRRASHIREGKREASMAGSSCGRSESRIDERRAQNEKRMMNNLPTFNGSEPFASFYTRFETLCRISGCDDELKFGNLVAQLRGTASLWLGD